MKINHDSHQIPMELDVKNSKLLEAFTFEDFEEGALLVPFEAVDTILEDIISRLGTLNRIDLPMYIAALEVLSTSLKTNLSSIESRLLETLLECSDVTTIHRYVKGDEEK